MRRITAAAAVLSLPLLVLAPSASAGDGPTPPTPPAAQSLILGVQVPLSGADSAAGLDILRGARLAVQQVNAAGGVDGVPIRILPLDDAADPERAAAVAARAARAGAFGVIGPWNSAVALRNQQQYVDSGIVTMNFVGSDRTIGYGATLQLRNTQAARSDTALLSSFAPQRVSVLFEQAPFTRGLARSIAGGLRAAGIAVRVISLTAGKSDYSREVADAIADNPDALYVSTLFPEGAAIATELAASTWSNVCVMGQANVEQALLDQAGLAAARCRYSSYPTGPQLPGRVAAAFTSDFTQRFRTTPGVWAPFAFDSVHVLVNAARQVGTDDYGQLLRAVRATRDYPGATGSITLNPRNGNRLGLSLTTLVVSCQPLEFEVFQQFVRGGGALRAC